MSIFLTYSLNVFDNNPLVNEFAIVYYIRLTTFVFKLLLYRQSILLPYI